MGDRISCGLTKGKTKGLAYANQFSEAATKFSIAGRSHVKVYVFRWRNQ